MTGHLLQDPSRGVQKLTLRFHIEKGHISISLGHRNTAERFAIGMSVDSPVEYLMSTNDKIITYVLNRVVSGVAVLGRLDSLVFLLTKGSAMVITSMKAPKLPSGLIFGYK